MMRQSPERLPYAAGSNEPHRYDWDQCPNPEYQFHPPGASCRHFAHPECEDDLPTSSPTPVALILGGSGPLDRDGNVDKVKPNISGTVADLLASSSWASLRYDKRGVGQSPGDYYATGFFDEIADAQSALDWLRTTTSSEGSGHGQPLVIIGHSSGAVQAGELAARNTALASVILLSTSTKSGEQTLRWKANEIISTTVPTALQPVIGRIARWQQNLALGLLRRSKRDSIRILFIRINPKWFREFMAHNPTRALVASQCRIFALTGTKDVQVDYHALTS
jgi:alpha/beta superfamily hydrolase